jgi:hypothetical protein
MSVDPVDGIADVLYKVHKAPKKGISYKLESAREYRNRHACGT